MWVVMSRFSPMADIFDFTAILFLQNFDSGPERKAGFLLPAVWAIAPSAGAVYRSLPPVIFIDL